MKQTADKLGEMVGIGAVVLIFLTGAALCTRLVLWAWGL